MGRMNSQEPIGRSAVTYWAAEEEVFVTGYDRESNPTAWEKYKAGLQEYNRRTGLDQNVEDAQLDKELVSVSVFWLVRDSKANVLGGFRWDGPLFKEQDVDSILGAVNHSKSKAFDQLRSAVVMYACNGGVAVTKGAWSASGFVKLGTILNSAAWHALRWFDIKTAKGVTDENRVGNTRSSGIVEVDGMEPGLELPNERTAAATMFCEANRFSQQDEKVRTRILREQGYIAVGKANKDCSSSHQLLFDCIDNDYRKQLIDSGVKELPYLKQQLEEARECGHGGELELFPIQAHPWIYYPWRKALVQVLAPDLFWKVRQNRNRNKLTLSEMDHLRTKRIGVVGLSVGASIAFCLAQQGVCGELRIADHDSLELSNLNRLPGSVLDLGLSKAEMARRRIAEINPFLPVHIFDEGVTEENVDVFLSGLDVVVEECDSVDIKLLIRQRARHFRIPVVMETADNGLFDVERYDLEDADPLHGLLPDLPIAKLKSLTTEDKVTLLSPAVGPDKISARFGASIVEVDSTLQSWPQLAEEISLGTAMVVGACRRILLGENQPSGRIRKGIDEMLKSMHTPSVPVQRQEKAALQQRPPLPRDPVAAVKQAAQYAPSGGNAQPWRFEVGKGFFAVHVRDDLHSVGMDIGGRATRVACGAALANAWCAASHLSLLGDPWEPQIYSDPVSPNFCGQMSFGKQSDDLAYLGECVLRRCSNRNPGPSERLEIEHVRNLERTAVRGGGRMIYVPVDELGDLLKTWVETDRIRYLTKRLHDELFMELRMPYEENLQEGIDMRTLELSDNDKVAVQLLRRWDIVKLLSDWDLGHRLGGMNVKLMRRSAGLLFVAVEGKTLVDYTRGGFAMQLVWLEATRLGLGMQPMTPFMAWAQSKDELVDLVGEERAETLHNEKKKLFARIGLQSNESLIIALRVHRGPPPSAISERRPLP